MSLLKIFIVWLSFFLLTYCHKCIHDDLYDPSSFQLLSSDDVEVRSLSSDRVLQGYEPIRILADYSSKIITIRFDNPVNVRFSQYH